jgi:hypothetical protein
MDDLTVDPMQRKREADKALDETAEKLRELLRSACAQLDPWPLFPGTLAIEAVECEPPRGAGSDRGCIVVTKEGDLYELELGIDFKELAEGIVPDLFYARKESLKPIEDMHPLDYIGYAYNGLREVTRLLLERGVRGL